MPFSPAFAMLLLLGGPNPSQSTLSPTAVTRFANLALDCIHKEYPNKIGHVMNSDADLAPPRELTPAFCGCYDWHSAVHGHWLLVRLCRMYPQAEFVPRARAALAESFTPEKIAAEVKYLSGEGRTSFERPYGLAWFLQLCAELHEWDDAQARDWARIVEPLEQLAVERLSDWLPKLTHPVRTGEHTQTAFALGLVFDWARARGNDEFARLVASRAHAYFAKDRKANLAFEPDGQAFLSPILAEADMMRRVLPPPDFAAWLGEFLPDLAGGEAADWLLPAVVSDRSDPQLVHLDGLNLSRAWMLEGIAAGLPSGDPRIPTLQAAARVHRQAGLAALEKQDYVGSHWLGSFAVYLVTSRGL